MLAVKPETGDKEANFPYPFTQNLLPRTSASEVHRAAASSHTVTAPMAPPPAASPDASMKSASEIPMGSEYHSTGQMTDAPPAPREINQWGTTICPRLLEVSSLLVCKLTRHDLSSDVEVLVKCSPKDDASDQWYLSILAAPKKLLMLRGEETIGICRRHSSNMLKLSGLPLPRVTCAPGLVDTNLTLENKTTKVELVREKTLHKNVPVRKNVPTKV